MLTDATPRKANRAAFLESDRIRTLDLPQDGCLLPIAKMHRVRDEEWDERRCQPCLRRISECRIGVLQSPACGVRVLAARPLESARVGAPSFSGTTPTKP